MKHYTNTFRGYTTVVVEIEQTLQPYQVEAIVDILNELDPNPKNNGCIHQPLQVINKHDEDICLGHKFAVLTNHSDFTIQAQISDIAEIVSTGSLLTDTGYDLLAKYLEAAE